MTRADRARTDDGLRDSSTRPGAELAAGLLLGAALDAVLGDPRHGHPVALFGQLAARLERAAYHDSRASGVRYVAVLAGGSALAASLAGRLLPTPAARVAAAAALTWTVLGGTSLRRAGRDLASDLRAAEAPGGDLEAARARLPTLCGRDPAGLDASAIARGGIESVAENTADAVVGPLLWGAVAGLPGLVGYRAANTLDAMVGYRSDRYRNFGWAAARLDDVATYLPARVAAVATWLCAPLVGGSGVDAFWVTRRDGRSHPSPNAGQVEAAFAGALGIRLGGELRYPHGVEHRPRLGYGRPPQPSDLERAAALSGAVGTASVAVAVGVALARPAAGRVVRRAARRCWARCR